MATNIVCAQIHGHTAQVLEDVQEGEAGSNLSPTKRSPQVRKNTMNFRMTAYFAFLKTMLKPQGIWFYLASDNHHHNQHHHDRDDLANEYHYSGGKITMCNHHD